MSVSDAALQASIDLIEVPATLLDLDGRIRHVNPALARLLGRTAEELCGQPVGTILPAEMHERTDVLLASLLDHGTLEVTFSTARSDGTTVSIEISAAIVRAADDTPRRLLATVRDLRPELDRLTRLNGSALGLLTAPGDDLLVTIVRVARELLGARYAALGVVEDGRLVRFIPDGMSDSQIGGIEHWPDGRGLLGAMITEQRTMRLLELGADPRSSGFPPGHPPMRSFLGTSIRAGDEVYGHLYFTDKLGATEFSLVDERLAELFASHAASAIRDGRQRAALQGSERNLAEAQRVAHTGSWERDIPTGALRWSDEACRIFGFEPGTFAGTLEAHLALVLPDDRATATRTLSALEQAPVAATEYRIVRPDGTIRALREEAQLIRDPSGAPLRMVGTVQDMTERVAAEEERTRLVAAVEQTADAVWMKDIDGGMVTYVNPSFIRLYGYEPDEIVGRHARILHSGRHETAFFDAIWASVATGRTWAGTIVNRRKDGTPLEVEAVISGIRDASGRLISYMQTDRDVTRERALENALERRAREREMIEATFNRMDSSSTPEVMAADACAEMVKLTNVDSAFVIALDGEDHGLVLAVEGRVAAVYASNRVIPGPRARYLLERASAGAWTEEWHARAEDGTYGDLVTATGLRTVAYAPLRGPGGVIGVVGLGIHDRARDAFVEQLPVLTTLASILGTLLAPGLEARHREDDARASVQGILDAGAFTPFFQPIVEFHTGAVVGYEALSRFSNGTPPDVTFALAGRSGLGLELETATLGAALEAAAALPPDAYLSLNASPVLIRSGGLRAILGGHERAIVLEITEHVVIEDYPALRRELAALGPNVRLAVDDAGAGYASLRHILELAPSFVKLDIGLIRGLDADPARQALIAGMGYFALKRRIGLVAEGIETAAELKALRGLGIGYGQGYLLGRPEDGRGSGPWPTRINLSTNDGGPG